MNNTITEAPFSVEGLSNEQVLKSRKEYGSNKLDFEKENHLRSVMKRIITDPMVILLLVAAGIYFITGRTGDGIFLAFAILFQTAISFYQSSRTKIALAKLKNFTQPRCKVIRNSQTNELSSDELVLGDSLLIEEGSEIPADGTLVFSSDFSVNESILTGEPLAVVKDITTKDKTVYRGTTVERGVAIVEVTAIGNSTKLGSIGKSIEAIKEEKTPLELQIANFVTKMAYLGGIIFILVWGINFLQTKNYLLSLTQALTLAMSILPEEIPVAFTTFMALGAWRLMKKGIVVKQMKTVETLGSATVICTDKTGTLTENKMSLAKFYNIQTTTIFNPNGLLTESNLNLLQLAMFASEPLPFDPMEIALHDAYSKLSPLDERPLFRLIHEYPLGGKPPMMTHIFENKSGKRVIAAKGAVEALVKVSQLTVGQLHELETVVKSFTSEGYRVLGIAESPYTGKNFPATQQEFTFQFKGVVAFYDPPKKNSKSVLQKFYKAGIDVKIITGDNVATTTSIAKQIGFKNYEKHLSGNELMQLSDEDLQNKVLGIQLFTRMFPEAKLRVINALKAQNQVVAMIGDGVNDGPALKAAHIGIAMGKKGTEIAKQASSLILVQDDLSKLVTAIAMGRKIYANLKKAIQYIISIHIPIILTVFLPLLLGWIYPSIFSPVHIIFLELIMGPTCSIIYENEPLEKFTMKQQPRPLSSTFFSWKELATSIVQGLFITVGTLFVYQLAIHNNYSESYTRTMIFSTLITANIVLTLVNRSFYYSFFTTLNYKNPLVGLIIGITLVLAAIILYFPPITHFLKFETLTIVSLTTSCGIGFLSVAWYEIVKAVKRFHPIDV